MNKGDYVSLKKLAAIDNAEFRTPEWSEYAPGENNFGVSVPVEYQVTGVLIWNLQPGSSVAVDRDSRNGVPSKGILQTSRLMSIEKVNQNKFFLETRNSRYEMEILKNVKLN